MNERVHGICDAIKRHHEAVNYHPRKDFCCHWFDECEYEPLSSSPDHSGKIPGLCSLCHNWKQSWPPLLAVSGKTQTATGLVLDASELPLPPNLQVPLALAVCVQNRWADGARAALRQIWLNADSDAAATECLRLVSNALTPQERFWLATFDGDRKVLPA